jgi:hypothetical protein
MACWVVPSVAAELWDCHIDRITNAIRDGHLKTREENGWMFVDVAPASPVMETGKALWAGSPWTHDVVSREEMEALSEPMPIQNDTPERLEVVADTPEQKNEEPDAYQIDFSQQDKEEQIEEELPALHIADEEVSDDEASETLADFRQVRRQVARTRIPPMIKTKAA